MFPPLSLKRRWLRFRHLGFDNLIGRHKASPPIIVETDVPADVRAKLFARTASTWAHLGATDAAYSVLTSVGKGNAGQNLMASSGMHDANVIACYFARAGRPMSAVSAVLEFGCGVGRVTQHIAAAFPRVVAVDISQPHLDLARAAVSSPNTEFVTLKSIEQLSELPMVDLFYSIIVLQHNSPPVQKAMLDRLLDRVNRGGFALFQVPTYIRGYRYAATEQLAQTDAPQTMEMHPLPQSEVFGLLAKHGFRLLEVQEDDATGSPSMLSHTFFAERASI